jgi:hypothetical protein
MTVPKVVAFRKGFPKELLEQGHRAGLDTEERRRFAKMLRAWRGTLGMELRQFNESVIDRRAHIERTIAEADALIEPLEAGLED